MSADNISAGPPGSAECPICGVAQVHGHGREDIEAWLQAQASRFGYFIRAFPRVELRDGFLYHALEELEKCQREWEAAMGYPLRGYTDAIDGLREFAATDGPSKEG